MRQVLVGVDESDTSLRALAFAFGLARRDAVRLLVAHVEEPPPPHLRTAYDVDRWIADQRGTSAELRARVMAACRDAAIDCEVIARPGHPYPELAETARARQIDSIVVGASRQGGHLLVGSVAGRLIRSGICPVTVVP